MDPLTRQRIMAVVTERTEAGGKATTYAAWAALALAVAQGVFLVVTSA